MQKRSKLISLGKNFFVQKTHTPKNCFSDTKYRDINHIKYLGKCEEIASIITQPVIVTNYTIKRLYKH